MPRRHFTMLKLRGVIQNYQWGKKGNDSKVAQLAKNANPNLNIDSAKSYAELWFGTHRNGPSEIVEPPSSAGPLAEWIEKHPSCLGEASVGRFGRDLPYLLKVLSVRTALSIQAHPDKKLAERLHAERPEEYKDPNHKPEMAIAITPFEALCGFREIKEILYFLKEIEEFRNVVDRDAVLGLEMSVSEDEIKKSLYKCFYSLMTCKDDIRVKNLTALVDRFQKSGDKENEELLPELFLHLHSDFPGDVGCFAIYFFHYLKLNPGEAIFLGPNEAHAYLHGDCVEIMACSDNTIRAGLTPKFKDIPTLCDMLTYRCEPCESKLFKGTTQDQYTTTFVPPVPDFAITIIEIDTATEAYKLKPVTSASVLLVVSGEAMLSLDDSEMHLRSGDAAFLPASTAVTIHVNSKEILLCFQAMSNA